MASDNELQRLYEKEEVIKARIRKLKSKLRADDRRDDTRRKILAGATVLEWAASDNDFSIRLMAELNRFLVRDADRALFNLPERGHTAELAPRKPPARVSEARDLTHSAPELERA